MALRAVPQAPGHDGTRQLALAFLFLVLLAGGAAAALERRWPRLGVAALTLALATSLYDCVRYHPLELSYYSPVVGGLPGVVGKFEPTYFWDACTPDVREFLRTHTPPGGTVLFATNPRNWDYLHRWRQLAPAPHGPGLPESAIHWYVLQHRPSQLRAEDHWLIAKATPAYERRLFGVPLVAVYSEADLRRAVAATRGAAP